jgi:CRISPR/Cas system-associated exonuclease Cas4 (RecB family)
LYSVGRAERLKGRGKYLRASEVAEYVYCARAWRLRVEGHEPASGEGRRAAGEAWHLAHGRAVVRARRLRRLAGFAFALALVVGLLILLLRWR